MKRCNPVTLFMYSAAKKNPGCLCSLLSFEEVSKASFIVRGVTSNNKENKIYSIHVSGQIAIIPKHELYASFGVTKWQAGRYHLPRRMVCLPTFWLMFIIQYMYNDPEVDRIRY